MDTLGSLIDKLFTIDMKMWYAQEDFYFIRKMTFDEFKEKFKSDEGLELLWNMFNKGIDLNLQRNDLIDAIDKLLVDFGYDVASNNSLVKYLQRKHKTY